MNNVQKWLEWQRLGILAGVIFIAVFPLLSRAPFFIHVFNMFFIWSVVASNWNLIMGYAGIWSMANVAFMAIGGYISALLSLKLGWSPWVCIPVAGFGTMITVTLFIGLPCLRLRGIYVALMSLMFASTLPTLSTQTRSVSGGSLGLQNIPPLIQGMNEIHAYYINFAFFLGMLAIVYRTIHSSSGLAFVALRDSRELATASGISEYREKLKVFALSSFLTGIAGSFYVHHIGNITPSIFNIEPFLMALAMMAFGGIGRFPGAVLGAAVLVFGGEWLRLFGILRFVMVGGLICAVILFFPGGLMELIDQVEKRITRLKHRASASTSL
jgi:branched-chain amino acid transport system permease protein